MLLSELTNKKVLIVGLGLSGRSVARFFQEQGVGFDVANECTAEEVTELEQRYCCDVITSFDSSRLAEYDVLVISPGIPRSTPGIASAISKGKKVIGDVELFSSIVTAPILAITGSNGKSTVVAWLEYVLVNAGIKAVACGNIGLPVLDSLHTEHDVYVLELSSYQLESTVSLAPLIATVLNVSDDHLDRYVDIDHYAAVKRSIYNSSAIQLYNQADKRTWPERISSNDACFSLQEPVDTGVRWHRKRIDNQWWLCDGSNALVLQSDLSLPGDHNAANALVVMALAEAVGVSLSCIKKSLCSFTGLKHRGEYLGQKSDVRWYNDSKGTNIDACEKAILSMQRPVLLIAGGMAKGADFRKLQSTVQQHVKLLILLGRDRETIRQQLSSVTSVVLVDDIKSAVLLANKRAKPGDAVLLSPACSSFDMFQNFEDRGNQFSSAVHEVLAA